jgi:hypothetical protein
LEIAMQQTPQSETNDAEQFRPSFTPDEYVVLREVAAKRKKRFWNDYPFLISLLAFLLSLTTAVISARVAHKKDVHDQLTELSAALRTLRDLNLKQVEIREKYAGGSNEGAADALLVNEVYNTTMNAADIAFRVGTNATTASIIPLSQNLYTYGQVTRAIRLAELGIEAAQTGPDEVTALRWLGVMKSQERTPQSAIEAAEFFRRALNFEQKFGPMRIPEVAQFIKAGVYLEWADTEASTNCEEAQRHFSEGWSLLGLPGRTADIDRLRRMASTKLTSGIGRVATCLPNVTNPASK